MRGQCPRTQQLTSPYRNTELDGGYLTKRREKEEEKEGRKGRERERQREKGIQKSISSVLGKPPKAMDRTLFSMSQFFTRSAGIGFLRPVRAGE